MTHDLAWFAFGAAVAWSVAFGLAVRELRRVTAAQALVREMWREGRRGE